MSYALGTKLVPGQIHFQTTRSGKIPSLQPLVEAGLPIAPYIEHGSYATGQPAIMRYGRDPYRGLGSNGDDEMARRADQMQTAVETTITETIRATLSPAVMIGTGAFVGAAAGISGGVIKSALWGGLIGAVGGGVLGYLGWRNFAAPAALPEPPAAASGLSGLLAVM
jgi:hypothetical protein